MSRPAKPTTCPLCHAELRTEQPVYHTRTKEIFQVKCWTRVGPVDTGKTDVRYLDWYTCKSCARKEHPEFFPTVESLKPLLDKMTANPDDWEASWNYKEAKERCIWSTAGVSGVSARSMKRAVISLLNGSGWVRP